MTYKADGEELWALKLILFSYLGEGVKPALGGVRREGEFTGSQVHRFTGTRTVWGRYGRRPSGSSAADLARSFLLLWC